MEPETLSSIERAELAFSIVGGTKSDELEVAFIRARWLYLTGDIVAAVEKLREIHAEREALAKHTAGEVALLLGKSLKAAGESEEALVLPQGSAERLQFRRRPGPRPAGPGRHAGDQAGPASGPQAAEKAKASSAPEPVTALGERPAGQLLVGLNVTAARAGHHVLGQRRRRHIGGPVPA